MPLGDCALTIPMGRGSSAPCSIHAVARSSPRGGMDAAQGLATGSRLRAGPRRTQRHRSPDRPPPSGRERRVCTVVATAYRPYTRPGMAT